MAVSYLLKDGAPGTPAPTVSNDTTQRFPLGYIGQAEDATYGDAELMYVKFTGTVAAGDFVAFDRFNKTCIQTPTTAAAAKGLGIGISLAAQTSGAFGWVLIRGVHDGANVVTATAAGALLSGGGTAGQATTATVNYNFDIATCKTLAASNKATVELLWPAVSGR